MMNIRRASEYRDYWMGLAMLWILLFHSKIPCSGLMEGIRMLGYGGVDIFIFASGVGCYYSYRRDYSPLDFLARRIRRLAPGYIPFILVWMAWNLKLGYITIASIPGNLLGIQGFTANGGEFNWYITAILLCYILTPYLASYVERHSLPGNILLVMGLVLVSAVFWGDTRLIISVARLPVFLVGMIMAKEEKRELTPGVCLLFAAVALISFGILLYCFGAYTDSLWDKGLAWYPFSGIVPGMCVGISGLIRWIRELSGGGIRKLLSPLIGLLKILGVCSWEVFLVHCLVFEVVNEMIERYSLTQLLWIYLGAATVSVVIAIGYHRILEHLHVGRK